MNFENILERFILLSGLSREKALEWKYSLEDAGRYVRTLCVGKELSESDSSRLDRLAGVYAYCRYICYTADMSGGFRAGDLTVHADKSCTEKAERLWQSELRANRDLVSDSCFLFGRVV